MNFYKIQETNLIKILCILANSIIFCSTPYITPYIIPYYQVYIALGLVTLNILTWIYISHYKFDKWNKIIAFCICASIIHGLLTFAVFFDENGIEGFRNTFGFLMKYSLLFPIIVLIKRKYKYFLNVLWWCNLFIVFLSIILFFLCLNGIYLPYIEFSPDGRPHYFFYLGSSNALYEFGNFIFIRIAGYCDEPGRLALVLTYLLVLNEFTYKNKWNRLFISFAGLLTFSIAFFITYIPIIFYWFSKGYLKIRNILLLSFSICLFSIIVEKNIEPTMKESIEDATELLITGRFDINSDGKLSGDNRSGSIGKQLKAFLSSPLVGVLGKNESIVAKYRLGDPTFISNLARYGLFDLLFYAPFIYLFLLYRKRKESLLFYAIALNFLQRPELEHMFFLVVLTLIYYKQYYSSDLCSK